ncbi:hypothetical protein [Mycolicibacterium elephantis]|uniref:hypothetical protein n=1 Tax=Mycolicibacterium elephantis TaxID=81858 RepID=UPI000FE2564C|nr:hypothetical protein [Mycolicibacterium elephantis]MCV7222477.1 hypothetical protein [Mycolicibacterium elephantis]
MNAPIRSCLSSAVAVIGVSGLVSTAAISPPELDEPDHRAVALTAQSQLLPPPAVDALTSPLVLIDRQATFHIELLTDFLVTGAELFGRIPPIAGALLQDIGNGTPLPTALSRALRDFADVEFEAGRELVGFAEDWANFQIQFMRDLVAGLPDVIADGPFGQLVNAALDVASLIVEGVVAFSHAVITVAETVVGDVLGEDAEAPAPASAVVAAETTPQPSAKPALLRTVEPQPAADETGKSVDVDVSPAETTEPSADGTSDEETSEDSSGEAEEPTEDSPVTATTATTRQPRVPRSIAEVREALSGPSARSEDSDASADTPDTKSDAKSDGDDGGHDREDGGGGGDGGDSE